MPYITAINGDGLRHVLLNDLPLGRTLKDVFKRALSRNPADRPSASTMATVFEMYSSFPENRYRENPSRLDRNEKLLNFLDISPDEYVTDWQHNPSEMIFLINFNMIFYPQIITGFVNKSYFKLVHSTPILKKLILNYSLIHKESSDTVVPTDAYCGLLLATQHYHLDETTAMTLAEMILTRADEFKTRVLFLIHAINDADDYAHSEPLVDTDQAGFIKLLETPSEGFKADVMLVSTVDAPPIDLDGWKRLIFNELESLHKETPSPAAAI